MKYAMYTQNAQKVGKNPNGTLMYAVTTADAYESDDASDVMTAFTTALNTMANRDRLSIEFRTFTADDGTVVMCAEYVAKEGAITGKMQF